MKSLKQRSPGIAQALILGFLLSFLLSVDIRQLPALATQRFDSWTQKLLSCYTPFGSFWMIMPFGIAFLICSAWQRQPSHRFRDNTILCVISLVFGMLNMMGQELYYIDDLLYFFPAGVIMLLYALACALVFYYTALLLLSFVPLLFPSGRRRRKRLSSQAIFWIAFGVIFIGWLPWMIVYYPMSADWDVYLPIRRFLGELPPSNSFPWFFSCHVGLFYKLGLTLGDKNIGMFLYVLTRALFMAAIYADTAARLDRSGFRRGAVWACVCFYAFVPVWGAYAKHGFKDTISAALFCLYIVSLIETIGQIRHGSVKLRTLLTCAAASALVCLYRNNGFLIVLPVSVVLVICLARLMRGQKGRVRTCAILLSGIAAYGAFSFYIFNFANVSSPVSVDSMTIVLQQTARTVRVHEQEITDEERETIGAVLDYNTLSRKYDPLLSDPVKNTWHGNTMELKAYLLTWFRMFFKYPLSYVEATVAQSYGYYAFTGDQAPNAGNKNCGMTIFNWVKDPRFTPELTCDYIGSLEPIRTEMNAWPQLWHRLPLLGLTDMKAVYTWFIVLIGYLMLREKRRMALIPVLACLINILLCCLSPVNDCFRYFCPIAAASPALLLLIRQPGRDSAPAPQE